jgi:uncharacterized protein YybS (DUF2232 family)
MIDLILLWLLCWIGSLYFKAKYDDVITALQVLVALIAAPLIFLFYILKFIDEHLDFVVWRKK